MDSYKVARRTLTSLLVLRSRFFAFAQDGDSDEDNDLMSSIDFAMVGEITEMDMGMMGAMTVMKTPKEHGTSTC